MGPSGSTLRGHPNRGAIGIHLPAVPGELVALLLPIVRRSIRTEGGPVALVRWLRQQAAVPRRCVAPPEPAVRRLTESLVRALLDPPVPLGDTLTDSRVHEDQAPAAS